VSHSLGSSPQDGPEPPKWISKIIADPVTLLKVERGGRERADPRGGGENAATRMIEVVRL